MKSRWRVALNSVPMSPITYVLKCDALARIGELALCNPDAPLGVVEERETLRREAWALNYVSPRKAVSWGTWLWLNSKVASDSGWAYVTIFLGITYVRMYSLEWKRV
jgi:hypothetical protein